MDNPAAGEGAEEFPSFGPACSTCNKPDNSNMTWGDGVKYFFSTYYATPRMWPIGYILDSHYSPLRLERHYPNRNWRDAFEDLLAVEAGRDMISNESRNAEDEYASRNRYELASRVIAEANLAAQENPKLLKEAMEVRQLAVKNGHHHHVKVLDEYFIPSIKSKSEGSASRALETKSAFEKNRTATASSLKPRGQWIASLINSGALPTWNWDTWQSIAGPMMNFTKQNPPPPTELDAGISISEHELEQIFERGQPHAFGAPPPLPDEQVRALTNGSMTQLYGQSMNPDPLKAFLPSPSSIVFQSARSEPVQLPGGAVGTKVRFENTLANGKAVVKEFIQEPAKVLEEVENARKCFEMLIQGVAGIQLGKEMDETMGKLTGHETIGELL